MLNWKSLAWSWYMLAWAQLVIGILTQDCVRLSIAFGNFVLFVAFLKASLDTEKS